MKRVISPYWYYAPERQQAGVEWLHFRLLYSGFCDTPVPYFPAFGLQCWHLNVNGNHVLHTLPLFVLN